MFSFSLCLSVWEKSSVEDVTGKRRKACEIRMLLVDQLGEVLADCGVASEGFLMLATQSCGSPFDGRDTVQVCR